MFLLKLKAIIWSHVSTIRGMISTLTPLKFYILVQICIFLYFKNIYINSLTRIERLNFSFDTIFKDIVKLYDPAFRHSYHMKLLKQLTLDFIKNKDFWKAIYSNFDISFEWSVVY